AHARGRACGPSHSRQLARCNRFMPSIVHAGAHLEVAIGGVVIGARIERKRVRAIDGAVADAVDRRVEGPTPGRGRGRTRCLFGSADAVSPVARADGEGVTQNLRQWRAYV